VASPTTAVPWTVTTLDNGLRLVTTPLPHSQAAVLAVYVGVGSRAEQRATLGLSHYLEHMLFKGTKARPTAAEISSAIEGAGGALNAFTTKELTTYWNRVPYDRLDLAMEILSDSVQDSLLVNEEVERERTVIQQEIRRASDEPAQRASQLLTDATYGDQPIGWDIAGDIDSVAAITRDDLINHIDTWYQPNNMVLSVAGNIDPDAVLALVQRHWQDLEPQPLPDSAPASDGMDDNRVVIEHRDIEQCNLGLALRTFPREDPDRYALTILNDVLGRGMSSRLFLEIRERRGLAYSIGSGTARFSDTGHLGVGAGVTSENVVEAAELSLLEIERLTREPVGAEELTKSIEHSTGSFRLSFETASSHCFRSGDSILMEGHILPINEVIDSLRAVTPDDIQRVAQRFVRRDNLAIAVVGPYEDAAPLEALLVD
jgi:predicted Zn-dependent peptidase